MAYTIVKNCNFIYNYICKFQLFLQASFLTYLLHRLIFLFLLLYWAATSSYWNTRMTLCLYTCDSVDYEHLIIRNCQYVGFCTHTYIWLLIMLKGTNGIAQAQHHTHLLLQNYAWQNNSLKSGCGTNFNCESSCLQS